MSFFTGKKLLLIGFLAILLAVIPLTVYFIVQNQTSTQSKATAATTLSFVPTSTQTTPLNKNIGESFGLDIKMNPGGGNNVIATTLYITFDPSFLELSGETDIQKFSSIPPSSTGQGFTEILAGPTFTPEGTAAITLTVGVDVTKAINQEATIARINFKGKKAGTAVVNIDFVKSNVTSLADEDVNVLSGQPNPAYINLAGGSITPTVTPTSPTATISPTRPPTTTGTITPTATGATITPTGTSNQSPTCSSLAADRTTTGAAPFSITFTANGTDPDGTINSVTFDFSDGPVQTVTQGGGIGTQTVNTQLAHTYNTAGTFTAKATLTDNKNAVNTAICSQTITVTAGSGGTGGDTGATATPIIITATPQSTPATKDIDAGPGEAIFGMGILGIGLTILGALAFFAL